MAAIAGPVHPSNTQQVAKRCDMPPRSVTLAETREARDEDGRGEMACRAGDDSDGRGERADAPGKDRRLQRKGRQSAGVSYRDHIHPPLPLPFRP